MDPDISFIIVLIEKSKTGQLVPFEVKEKMAFIPLDKFFDYLDYIEKDAI